MPPDMVQSKKAYESLSAGIQKWADDHDGACPPKSTVSQSGLKGYVPSWPKNPVTGKPMAQGTDPGDFAYSVSPDGTTWNLTLFDATGGAGTSGSGSSGSSDWGSSD